MQNRLRLATASAVAFVFAVAGAPLALGQVSPDLVSRTALRVCSDPSNLPFSNRKKQGFENRIADIVGDELKEPVRYLWAPSGPGFARNTLNSDFCDIVMGYTIGSEVVQSTNPYYRSTYVLVTPKGSDLTGIESLDDPRLKGHSIGVFAATPPVDVMLAKGLMDKAQVYPLLVDHRFDSPLNTMMSDLKGKKIEAAIVWGPLVGLDVKNAGGALVMTLLLKDVDRPGFSYRITFGIRHDEPDWKHKLEAVIRKRKTDINKVLVEYDVPLIDDSGKIIPPPQAVSDVPPSVGPEGQRAARFKMPGPAPTNGAPTDGAPGNGAAAPPGFKMPGPAPTNAPR